jgi:LPS-assembly protein
LSCSPKSVYALLLLGSTLLFSQQQYELYADKLYQEGNTTRASGDVLLRDEARFMRANRLIFCRERDEAELFGNVYFDDPAAQTTFVTDYLRLEGEQKQGWSDNLYAHFNESGLWLSGDEAFHEEGRVQVSTGVLSGCKPHSPDWSIRFSRAVHHQEAQWLNLYNARLYAGRVPVFYTPYFGHSTDMTRRSGLLFPRFGSAKDEGTLYEQPLYIALQEWWDLELWHQTRTERGTGAGATLRFVDSRHSKGQITAGRFDEKRAFMEEFGIENQRHSGVELSYDRSRLFSRGNHQEGLKIRYRDYSDVDYLQLESIDPDKRNRTVEYIQTDEADYFYKADAAYGGLYLRHFTDLRDRDRQDMVQILPEAHGHLFTRSLLSPNLLYSLDLRHRSYTRDEGREADEGRIVLPLSYHTALLGDFLQLSASYQVDHYQISYSDESEQGLDRRESVSVGASTLLARDFNDTFHTIGVGLTYYEPLNQTREGVFFNDFSRDRQAGESSDPSLSFVLDQYLYNAQGLNVISHRASQVARLDDNRTLLELENEVIFRPTRRLSLRNLSRYSHTHDTLVSASTSLEVTGRSGLSISHLYRNPEARGVNQRYLQATAHHRFNSAHYASGSIEHDLLTDEIRRFRLAYQYNRGCWLNELSFERTTTPYAASGGGTNSRTHDIIFLKMTLVPLGEIVQQLYDEERG